MSELKTYRIQIDTNLPYFQAVWSVLSTFSQYVNCKFEIAESEADFSVGLNENASFKLDDIFWKNIFENDFSTDLFADNLILKSGDLIGSAFYFLNCLWERDAKRLKDSWGRSEFSNSIWKEFGHKAPFNHVNRIFNSMAKSIEIELQPVKSTVFLSHDIDAVYSGWLENGVANAKSLNLGSIFRSVSKHISGNPEWFNFNEIMELERTFGAKSTFFWIVANNKVPGVGKNADYDLNSSKISGVLEFIEASEFDNGIHKSLNNTSLRQETEVFNREILANRYHYLKFNFPDLIKEMEESGLKMDASLGYAEKHGFRNGYSLPFVPFNLEANRPSTFVEVPLLIMDATFSRYYHLSKKQAIEEIIDFMESNEFNALLSVLWHNTHFVGNKYKGYREVYESTLRWIKDRNLQVVGPKEIIQKFL